MTLGFLNEISSKSDQKTVFLTHIAYKELFDVVHLKNIEYIFTKKTLNSSLCFSDKFLSYISIVKLLAFKKFDTAYVCYKDKRYQFLLLFSFYKKIISLKENKDEYFGKVLLNWIGDSKFNFPKLNISNINGKLKKVILCPGGNPLIEVGKRFRMWPIEYFVELASKLIKYEYEVIVLGSKEDKKYESFFINLPIEFVFSSSIKDSIKTILSSFCVVSPDSGPMHLTLLCKKKLIALFGPTKYQTRVPEEKAQKSSIKIFSKASIIGCGPCYDGKNYSNCKNIICMKMITPDEVLNGIITYEDSISS